MLRGLTTVTLFADDMGAATRWYTELLGTEPYFERPGADGRLAYAEYRIGDYQHELGLLDRRYAPPGATEGTGGPLAFWHVDDIKGAYERMLSLGATEFEPPTPRGDGDFVTAVVLDPFGNTVGLMYNPHYVAVHEHLAPFELPKVERA